MKIAIDLGHGVGQDRGAEGVIAEEEVINSVGSLVIAKLRALGHTIIEVRPTNASNVSDSLIQRVDKANINNVDLYVSIHANAGGGQGTEVYTYRCTEVTEARNVLNNLVALGFTNRGIKGSNLYVINHTNAKAMLIEICFVDTKNDVELYNSLGVDKVANAIVNGLTGQTVSTPVVEPSTPNIVINAWIAELQAECNRQGFSSQTVDGIAGPNTLAGCPAIREGAQGNITKLLQEKLRIIADGIFGPLTKQAVINFQYANGLVADGIVGPRTWSKLVGLS